MTIADLKIFEELHLLDAISDKKVKDYPSIHKWYSKIFKNEHVQFYRELMIKQLNIDFPNNGIDFHKT